MAMTAAQKQDAYKFFIVSFGAITGVEYMNQINDAYNAGLTTKEIVNIYSTKPQFEAIYPRFLSNEQFADKLIENVVGASATAAAKTQAKADVVAAINAGWSKGDVVFQIFTNLSNKAADDADWGKTAAMLNNKVKVAEYYTETLLVNSLDLGALGSPLQSVTNDAASVEAAKKGSGSLNNGQTFTLTANTDFANQSTSFINNTIPSNFKFTSSNEVVEALNGTLTAADTLLDGTTSDNDVINVRVGATAPVFGTLQNIETINLIATNGVAMTAGAALNLANVTGAKTFNASGTLAGGLTINNAGTTGITTYDFSGITTTGANGAVTLNMGTTTPTAALKITGGAGNDVLTGGSGDDVMVGGAGNDTLNAGAGNNTVDVGAGAGAQFVTFSNGNNDVKATGATGAVTVTGGNGTNTVEVTSAGGLTVTLGSGANTITSGGGADNVTVGNGANTIVTGAGNDVIAVGTGANTITAGAGADRITTAANSSSTIVIGAGDSAVNGGALATADVITGFTTNGDKLKLGLTDGTGTNYVEAVDAATAAGGAGSTFAQVAALAQAQMNGTVQYVLVNLTNLTNAGGVIAEDSFWTVVNPGADSLTNTSSLLFVDRDLDGAYDQAIVLAGVNSATFAATDIIA